MYEARQNKEKVSRRIDADSGVRPKIKSEVTKNGIRIFQFRSFLDEEGGYKTTQIEGKKDTPWRKSETERPSGLSEKVDLFKKEMLTYIASCIEKKGKEKNKRFGPHIAVVLTNKKWYISINSNSYNDTTSGFLKQSADETKEHIKECWERLKQKFENYFSWFSFSGIWHNLKWFHNNEVFYNEEALYIAFRWAATKEEVEIVANVVNNDGDKKQIIHGEMQIIKFLNDSDDNFNWNDSLKKRVIRVGGTKTPCLDCGWEMGKVSCDRNIINGTNIHNDIKKASMVKNNNVIRYITTMDNRVGAGFPTWKSPYDINDARNAYFEPSSDHSKPNYVENYVNKQEQEYNNLRDAYNNIFGEIIK